MNFLFVGIVVIVAILLIATLGASKPLSALNMFQQQQNFVISRINKLLHKDITETLLQVFIPYSKRCYDIISQQPVITPRELGDLRISDKLRFDKLRQCGHIHNILALASLSLWMDHADVKTEQSLNLFIKDCLMPFLNSAAFIKGEFTLKDTDTVIVGCLKNL